jgi:hypothetical protein
MDCETCDHLLAAYEDTVRLFKDSARRSSGPAGDDSRRAAQEATLLSQKCKDASDALVEHWREHHNNFGKGAGSST